jgi:hypothetical protein
MIQLDSIEREIGTKHAFCDVYAAPGRPLVCIQGKSSSYFELLAPKLLSFGVLASFLQEFPTAVHYLYFHSSPPER